MGMTEYRFADVVIDHHRFCVVKAGEVRKITPRAFAVLVYLIESRERVVEKQELFAQVWKEAYVSDNALTRIIKEIRHVIGDSATAPRYIETLPKRGYRFIAALTDPPPPSGINQNQSDQIASSRLFQSQGEYPENGTAATAGEFLARGRNALSCGAWAEARTLFETVLHHEETAEAWEGVGLASWWMDDEETIFKARERAYLLYREKGDWRGAARVATALGWDCATFRGDLAIANGWLQRAQRLLEEVPLCAEHGWLLARQASNALFHQDDPEKALAIAGEAIRLGQRLNVIDLELASQAVQGVAMLCIGQVEAGIGLLDEVTAALVAGEMSEMPIIAMTACNLIAGCERIRDYQRAAEWCRYFREFCQRVETRSLFAICRTEYAEVLMWHGNWQEAEAELATASNDLQQSRPGLISIALIRLAKLRVRQGRLTEARHLLTHVEHYPLAQMVVAELALESGQPRAAIETSERFLRRIPAENLIERADCLELMIRAYAALQQREAAMIALSDLAAIAEIVSTKPLDAALSFSNGLLAALDDAHDLARCYFEDALDGFSQCGASFEAGLARIELARTLLAMKRGDAATQNAERAFEDLKRIGAELMAERATTLIAKARTAYV